jgi:hypothetical protein
MPTPKTKPNQQPAEAKHVPVTAQQPEQDSAARYRADQAAYEARQVAAKERAGVITNLLGDLNGHDLQLLETLRLMESRTLCGTNDPISKFITTLIFHYAQAEAGGHGLTVEVVEGQLEELREDMEFALGEARFIASRYSLAEPESSDAE